MLINYKPQNILGIQEFWGLCELILTDKTDK